MNVKLSFLSRSRYLILTLAFLILGVNVWGQMKVTGKVVDAKGQPLPVATIVEKGTKNLTMSADDGSFHLNNVSKSATLQFSLIGYKTLELPLDGRSILEVVMEEDAVKLDEVVVTALGISRQKKALGYAVQDVKGDELAKVRTGNVVSSLSGRLAGVQIKTAGGQLGGGAKINIRGNTSLTGNNQPLFVVDGIPISNADFSSGSTGGGGYDMGNLAGDLNADDIDNMSVLKGAQATALYGSRAANGVVMVTTKKAKFGEGTDKTWGVSVNSSVTMDMANHVPKYQKLYGGGNIRPDSRGGVDGFRVAKIDGKTYKYAAFWVDESWGPKYNPDLKVLMWNSFDKWDTANYLVEKPWVYPENDYTYFFKKAFSLQNNVAIQKLSENTSFRMSYTNLHSTGITPNSKLDKNSLNFNGSAKLSKYLDTWATINYVENDATGRPETGYGDRNPAQKMWQWIHTSLDYKDMETYLNPDGTQRTWNRNYWDDPTPAYTDNPYWSVYKNYQSDRRNRVFGNMGMNLSLNDWIKITGRIGVDYYNMVMETRTAIGSQSLSGYTLDNREAMETNYELFLSMNRRFLDEKIGFSAIFGTSRSDQKYWRRGGYTSDGLVIPEIYNLSNSRANALTRDYKDHKRINSIYANATFDWNQIVYLDLTARNDWSSTLPVQNRSYFYPSAGISVVLTSIEGLQNLDWLSFAKLRASFAKVGNDTDPYMLLSYYDATPGGPFAGYPRFNPSATKANPNLKAEITSSWEVGLETKFLNGRIGLDASYYRKDTYEQIMPLMVSAGTGYDEVMINAGQLSSSGFELSINAVPVKTKNFEWGINLNMATLRNKVEKLYMDNTYLNLQDGPFRVKVGAYVNSTYPVIYGTDYATDDQGNRLIDPETLLYVPTGIKQIGDVTPNLTMGLNNSFRYKGIDLNILFDMQRGGNMYYLSNTWGMYSGILEESALVDGVDIRENGILLNGVYGYLNNGKVVHTDKDGNNVTSPVINDQNTDGQTYAQGFYDTVDAQNVFSTDYIKLREISIGYTIPSKYTGPIKQLRVSAFGRNLLTLGKASQHFDPEYMQMAGSNAQGVEGGYIPTTKSFGFTISFNF